MTGKREPSRLGQSRAPAITLLTALGAAALSLPFLGFQASLAIPFVAQWQRRLLWPRASSATSWAYAFLALAGLWWPTVATFVSPLPLPFHSDAFWLIIPLCAPENLSTWLVPASDGNKRLYARAGGHGIPAQTVAMADRGVGGAACI